MNRQDAENAKKPEMGTALGMYLSIRFAPSYRCMPVIEFICGFILYFLAALASWRFNRILGRPARVVEF